MAWPGRSLPMGRRACPTGATFVSPAGVASAYLATELAAATPQHLGMLLYDGAIRLCRQALAALDAGQSDLAAARLAGARQSVHELLGRLPGGRGTAGRDQFVELYQQVHRDLIEADFYRRREVVREAILLLNDRRPAWSELVRSLDERPEALRVEASARSWVG